jgi:hypothetical protein
MTEFCEELTVVVEAAFTAVVGLDPLPPQPTRENVTVSMSIPSTIPVQRLRFFNLPANIMPNMPMVLRLASRMDEPRWTGPSREAETAAVVIVIWTVTGESPFSVTDVGLKVQVASEGNEPQVNVTVPL